MGGFSSDSFEVGEGFAEVAGAGAEVEGDDFGVDCGELEGSFSFVFGYEAFLHQFFEGVVCCDAVDGGFFCYSGGR